MRLISGQRCPEKDENLSEIVDNLWFKLCDNAKDRHGPYLSGQRQPSPNSRRCCRGSSCYDLILLPLKIRSALSAVSLPSHEAGASTLLRGYLPVSELQIICQVDPPQFREGSNSNGPEFGFVRAKTHQMARSPLHSQNKASARFDSLEREHSP